MYKSSCIRSAGTRLEENPSGPIKWCHSHKIFRRILSHESINTFTKIYEGIILKTWIQENISTGRIKGFNIFHKIAP